MRAWIFKRSQAKGCSSSPSPSSGEMPRACRREWADPAWPLRPHRGRCARKVHAKPELRHAVPEEAEPRWAEVSGGMGARIVFCHEPVRESEGVTEVVDHGGHDATGDECGERDRQRRAEAQSAAGDARGGLPTGVVRQVSSERSADRGPQLSVKSDQRILVQHVSVDAHVIHKLGDISALPREDHLGGA